MKFKLTRTTLILFAFAALVLLAFTPSPLTSSQDAPPPTMPDWAIALLNVGFTWLITNGLKSLSKTLPWVPTLEGQATALVAALVGFVVVFGNGLLSMIPADYHAGVAAGFVFVGTLLSAYGVHFTVAQFSPDKILLTEAHIEDTLR